MEVPRNFEAEAVFKSKSEFYKINILSIEDVFLHMTSLKLSELEEEIEVFHTKIFAIISSSYLKNHALLVDNKFMIGIPFFHLKISDNLFTLIEVIKSLDLLKEEFVKFLKDEKLKKNNFYNKDKDHFTKFRSFNNFSSSKHSNSKTKMSKEDAILLEELNFLLRDHVKENDKKKNCKHCIIKFKKSSVIFNLIFGDFSTFFKDFHKTDFYLLERIIKNNTIKSEKCGIFIDFFSSQRLSTQIYKDLPDKDNSSKNYVVSLHWPLLLVTVDTGFFKNNMTIHCSRTITAKTKTSSYKKEKNHKYDMSPHCNSNENLLSSEKKNAFSNKRGFSEHILQKEDNSDSLWENYQEEEVIKVL